MKRKILAIVLFGIFAISVFALVACNKDNKDGGDKITVTWYDATGTMNVGEMTVLKTEQLEKGSKATRYTPTKTDEYVFVDWFAVPSKAHRFDFSQALNEDTAIYAGFSKLQADTRDFYILGSGTSELLLSSNWGNNITDAHKLTKTVDKNEYKITLDLMKDDEFQFAIDSSWHNQRGFGYLVETALADGTEVFTSNASPYSDAAKVTNIKVAKEGNYTLTLNTYPADDYYDTSNANYSEATKETYNRGTYDTITWVRNGDVENSVVTVTDFYIKGASITEWKDMYNAYTQMSKSGSDYSLTVWLKANDQVMFTSRVTKTEAGVTTAGTGSVYIKYNNLDADSQALFTDAGGNMVVAEDGMYTFAYNADTTVLHVTRSSDAAAELDFYLDGKTAAGLNWSAADLVNHKFVAKGDGVYALENVQLAANDELLIRAYASETAQPDYNNKLVDLDATYLLAGLNATANFDFAGENNKNIKVLTAGAYDIEINSYSRIVSINQHVEGNDTLDIYIKGQNINGWDHQFAAQWKFALSEDQTKYEFTLTVGADAVEFGLEKHPKGEVTGCGEYLGASAMGNSGDANSLFTPDAGSNFKCSTAGTYKIVYDISTQKVDFYTVQ